MHQIIDVFTKQIEVVRYSRFVPLTEISDPKNDYNLNIPRYVDSSEPEDIQDLHAHLKGGIPNRDLDALQHYWEAFPTLRTRLFKPLREGYSELRVEKRAIQTTISESDEYKDFAATINVLVSEWWESHRTDLEGILPTTKPNQLIDSLGESLLEILRPQPLIDEYGAYEQLLRYWNDTMHDDLAMVVSAGWVEAAKPRKAIEDKERKLTETPDLVIGSGRTAQKYKMDLLPPALIKTHYFADDLAKVEELIAESDVGTQELESFVEENGGEEGLLSEAMEDDKAKKPLAVARLKAAKKEADSQEEVAALTKFIELVDAEAAANRAVKDATIALDQKTLTRYGNLSEADIKGLILGDKWGKAITDGVTAELEAFIQGLTGRSQVLADRYERTISEIDSTVKELSIKVAAHLTAMGVK
jgi:type I restriction enzyme M protein